MNFILPPILPPIIIRSTKCCRHFLNRQLLLFMNILMGVSLVGCSMNQSNFNYESDVIATNLELRNSRYLKQWQVYSVKISGVKPGCSSTTFYQSSSSVFGNTITTTTKPVSGQVCYKGHGLSDEEMEKYKLIKAAEIAFE